MGRWPFEVNDARIRDDFLHRGVVDALAGLGEDAKPQWGKMTAQQMVEHLLWAFDLSNGKAQTECHVPESKREQIRSFLYDNRPTPREFMNPVLTAGLPALRFTGISAAKNALAAEVRRFVDDCGKTPDAVRLHPVFGPLPLHQWARAHFKHVYHHLLQFGLIC